MTPPKIKQNPFYSSSEQICRAPEPVYDNEAQVCRIDQYTSAAPTVNKIKPRLAARFQESSALALRGKAGNHVFAQGENSPTSSSALANIFRSLAHFNPTVSLKALAGCGGGHANEQSSPVDVPVLPPSESPTPVPTNPPEGNNVTVDDGIGATDANFGSSQCIKPADLDLSAVDSSLLMTCGEDLIQDAGIGAGLVEIVDPSSGTVSSLNFPTALDGDENHPIRLSTLVPGDGEALYAGFAPAGSPAQFESDTGKFADSGILIASQSDASNPTIVSFDPISLPDGVPLANLAGVTGADGNDPKIFGFQPNTPVSMARVGDTVYVLNANRALNFPAAAANAADPEAQNPVLDYAPASIHGYTIGGDGNLTSTAVGDQLVMVGTETVPGHAFVMPGNFNPTAVADVGDGRLAVVIKGIEGQEDPSSVKVFNIDDFSNGLNSTSDADLSGISISDSGGLRAEVNNSPQLAIVKLDGVPYGLLGLSDGSGRVALVNLAKDAPASERVQFFGVFDGDTNVASIVADGDRAYVVSDQGQMRALYLFDNAAEGVSFGSVGPLKTLASTPSGTPFVSTLSGASLVAAYPNGYAQASLTAGPSSSQGQ